MPTSTPNIWRCCVELQAAQTQQTSRVLVLLLETLLVYSVHIPHNELFGVQVRKLDFLLADAIEKGCDTILTLGGFQSNHARATAVAARELGLEPYVFILDFNSSLKVWPYSLSLCVLKYA